MVHSPRIIDIVKDYGGGELRPRRRHTPNKHYLLSRGQSRIGQACGEQKERGEQVTHNRLLSVWA